MAGIERSAGSSAASNAGFIGKGVEKIDIGGEYDDQSEITAVARDKITSVRPIQIVYRDRSEIGFTVSLRDRSEPMQLDPAGRRGHGESKRFRPRGKRSPRSSFVDFRYTRIDVWSALKFLHNYALLFFLCFISAN